MKTANQRRVTNIEKMLISLGYSSGNSPAESVVDLLSDLRHFCDRYSLDFAELDHQAYGHYTEELHDAAERVTDDDERS